MIHGATANKLSVYKFIFSFNGLLYPATNIGKISSDFFAASQDVIHGHFMDFFKCRPHRLNLISDFLGLSKSELVWGLDLELDRELFLEPSLEPGGEVGGLGDGGLALDRDLPRF